MSIFKFDLGQRVSVSGTSRVGVVIARSQSIRTVDQYLVEFVSKDDEPKSDWFYADQIDFINDN